MVPGSEAAPLLSDTAHGERTDQIRHFLDEGDGGEGLQETLRHNVPGRPACPRRPAAHRRTDVAAPSLAGGGQKGAPRRETPPLHEAVACHHEKAPSRRHRLQWMGEHLQDRIPLGTLFTMRNPVKESPLVELTVQLHERLARGEITVDEVNRQVSAYATSHAEELSQRGIRNMTYYAESLSVFEFLLESEGKMFIREMCGALKRGTSMDEIVQRLKAYPRGLSQLEETWVAWVQRSQ